MKNIFFLLAAILLAFPCKSMGLNLIETAVSQKSNGQTIKRLTANFNATGNWQLFVSPINNEISHTLYPNRILPVGRISIQNTDYKYEGFTQNNSCLIAQGSSTGIMDIPVVFKIINQNADYPGIYQIPVNFLLLNNNQKQEFVYNLQFEQAKILDVETSSPQLNIKIKGEDAFKSLEYCYLQKPARLEICANKNWKLFIKCKNLCSTYPTSFKVFTNNQNLQTSFSNKYYSLSETELLIMQGKPTLDSNSGNLKTEIINIDYRIKMPQDKSLLSGKDSIEIEYILLGEEED